MTSLELFLMIYTAVGMLIYTLGKKHVEFSSRSLKNYLFKFLGFLFYPVIILGLLFDTLFTLKYQKDYIDSLNDNEKEEFLKALKECDQEDNDDEE
jgi:hypothetical protein